MVGTAIGLNNLVQRLGARHALELEDREALFELCDLHQNYDPTKYLQREGDVASRDFRILVDGYAIGHKLGENGKRQITAILMPGDLIDGNQLFLETADHNIQALTGMQTLEVSRDAIRQMAFERPAIGRALWTDALINASLLREWLVNVSCRDARHRIAHLLCEFHWRLAAGEPRNDAYFEFPLTQIQLGDAVGLTSIHVNRTLRAFAIEGLISYYKKALRIHDAKALGAVGGFTKSYLHLGAATGSVTL